MQNSLLISTFSTLERDTDFVILYILLNFRSIADHVGKINDEVSNIVDGVSKIIDGVGNSFRREDFIASFYPSYPIIERVKVNLPQFNLIETGDTPILLKPLSHLACYSCIKLLNTTYRQQLNIMMKISHIPLLVILILSACSTDETTPDKEEHGNVTFLFKAGGEETTRTSLNSSDNLQHVEKVFLYIFNGIDDAASYMQTKEITWPAPGDVNYQTTSRNYSISLDPGAYTFLAVGLDDQSGATYNLPGSITTGTTLSVAKAILANGKTKADIAQSELFAGYAIAPNVQISGNTTVTMNLLRRVSGVIGWFRNIPYKLPDLASGTEVRKMTIELYTNQNKTIALKKAIANDYGQSPFSENENTMNNKAVLEYDLTGYTQTAGKNYYDVTAVNANNILQAGSYLLPVIAPTATTATLTLRYYDNTGTEIPGTSRTIKLVSSTSDGGTSTYTDTMTFAFEANQLYRLGTKDTPIDLDPGTIDDIVITVNPWWEGISGDIPLE